LCLNSTIPSLSADAPPILLDCNDPLLLKILRENNDAGAGPSGWCGNMISCLVKDNVCLTGLTVLLKDIINGNFTPQQREYLTASRLVVFHKNSGGLRPIAIGEVFYRLAARYILEKSKKVVGELLDPYQYGIGVASGCEKIVHSLRHLLTDSTNPTAVLKIDISNAFNSVNRAAILQTLYNTTELADLYRIADFAYGSPSLLLLPQKNQPSMSITKWCQTRRSTQHVALFSGNASFIQKGSSFCTCFSV